MFSWLSELLQKGNSSISTGYESTTVAKPTKLTLVENYSPDRLPAFPAGIPVFPIDDLLSLNTDCIKNIILSMGLGGKHNKTDVELKVYSPIRQLAYMIHWLPASENTFFRMPGGLFAMCLELSLHAIRSAERHILTRCTQEERRVNEDLWAQAAFLVGLYSEAIYVLARLSIYARIEQNTQDGIEYRAGIERFGDWLCNNQVSKYYLRWKPNEDRSMIYAIAGKTLQDDQIKLLAQGEPAIFKALLSALNDPNDLHNPLVKIVRTVRYKLIEREQRSDPNSYGKPLSGMHLEPWLIDAMRSLLEKKRWVVNDPIGRLWYTQEGLFIVWPLAASDMQNELKSAECPFVPFTTDILAEIMLDSGIIMPATTQGTYLFTIQIPTVENEASESNTENKPSYKSYTALKLANLDILFKPDALPEVLFISVERTSEIVDVDESPITTLPDEDPAPTKNTLEISEPITNSITPEQTVPPVIIAKSQVIQTRERFNENNQEQELLLKALLSTKNKKPKKKADSASPEQTAPPENIAKSQVIQTRESSNKDKQEYRTVRKPS